MAFTDDIPGIDPAITDELRRKNDEAMRLKHETGRHHCLVCLNPLTELLPHEFRCDHCPPSNIRLFIG